MKMADEGRQSGNLMASIAKQLQQISAAQQLQDSLRADLQKRREQARQRLNANQVGPCPRKGAKMNVSRVDSSRSRAGLRIFTTKKPNAMSYAIFPALLMWI